jgi:gliding motility-associated-like protein
MPFKLLFIMLCTLAADVCAQCGIEILANREQICIPGTVVLKARGCTTCASYEWNVGNGWVAAGDSFSVLVGTPGQYDVKVRFRTPVGGTCTAVAENVFTGRSKPVPAIATSSKLQCHEADSILVRDVTPHSVARDWLLDGRVIRRGEAAVNIRFKAPWGYKPIFLTVWDTFGCVGSKYIDSAVGAFRSVRMELNADPSNGCLPGKVTYTLIADTFEQAIKSVQWVLPGSFSSTLAEGRRVAGVLYKDAGRFGVKLMLNTDVGCRYNRVFDHVIRFGDSISLKLERAPTQACMGNAARFVVSGSRTGKPNWQWSTNSVQTTSMGNAMLDVIFTDTGVFSLTLKEDSLGCVGYSFYKSIVKVEGPLAQMTVLTPKYCSVPDTLNIENNSLELANGTTSYEWTLYDEDSLPVLTRTTKDLEWYPAKLHNWHARLIARGSNGCSDTIMRWLAVIGRPLELQVTETPNPACPYQIQTLKPVDTGTTGRNDMFFDWVLWDRQKDTFLRTSKKYVEWSSPDTGSFSYRVIGWNKKGCRDTLEKPDTIKIYYPDIRMSLSDSFVCKNDIFLLGSKVKMPSSTARRFWEGRNLDSGNNVRFEAPDSTLESLPKQGRYRFTFLYLDTANGGCTYRIPLPNQIYVSGPNISATVSPEEDCLPLKTFHLGRVHSDVDLAGEKLRPVIQWKDKYKKRSVIDSQTLRTTATLFRESQIYTFKYTGQSGCSDSIGFLHVQGGVQARFEIGASGRCRNDTFTMYNKTSRKATHYYWSCSDTTVHFIPSATVRQPYIIARKAGVFLLKLVATNNHRCNDTLINAFRVDSVRADFYSSDSITYCAPQMAELFNRSFNSRFNQWSFDNDTLEDRTTLNRTNAVKLLTSNSLKGVSVKLVVRTWNGCTDSMFRPDYLKTKGPTAAFSLADKYGCEPLRTRFTNQSSYFKKVIIDYGDGSVSDSTGISAHTYRVRDKSKPYQVYYPSYALYDSLGCYAYEKSKDSVVVLKGPEALFETDKRIGCLPLIVKVLNRTLFYRNIRWDFDGDGIFESADANPVWEFQQPGKYRPRVIASNENTCTDTFDLPYEIEVLPGPTADFSMSNDSSCYKDTVYFYNRSKGYFPIVKYSWDLGDETRFDDTSTRKDTRWAYPLPYDKQIRLTVTDSMGCKATRFRTLHIHDTLPPVHQGLSHVTIMPDNRTIGVYWYRYQPEDFLAYHLYQDSTKYYFLKRYRKALDTMYFTGRGDSVDARNFCFAIRTEDTCNILNGYGISHCTIVAKVEKPPGVPFMLRVKWTPYNGWLNLQHYEVFRSVSGGPFERWRIMKPWELEMYDSFLCEKEYYYYVVGVNAYGARSRSNETCGIPWYHPPMAGVPVRLATVDDSRSARIKWEPYRDYLKGGSYAIHRFDGKTNRQIGIGRYLEFSDTTALVNERSYTYRIHYIDHCGVKGPAAKHAATVYLTGKSAVRDARLKWTPYSYWHAGVSEYHVQLQGPEGEFSTRGIVPGTQTEWTDFGVVTPGVDTLVYRVLAIEDSVFADTSASNYAYVIPESRLFVPTAFTPNGDGINDGFGAKAIFVVKHTMIPRKAFMLEIYNRWGQLVFRTSDPDAEWDGTYMGQPCQDGVYAFLVKGVGYDGKLYVEEGSVSLLR